MIKPREWLVVCAKLDWEALEEELRNRVWYSVEYPTPRSGLKMHMYVWK